MGKAGLKVGLQKPGYLPSGHTDLFPLASQPSWSWNNSGIQLLFQIFKCYQPLECSAIPTAHVSYLGPYNFQDYSLFPVSLHFRQWLPDETWVPEGYLSTSFPSLNCLSFLASCLVDQACLHGHGVSLISDLTLLAWLSDQVTSVLGSYGPVYSDNPPQERAAAFLLPIDSRQASLQVALTLPTRPAACLFSAIRECHHSFK